MERKYHLLTAFIILIFAGLLFVGCDDEDSDLGFVGTGVGPDLKLVKTVIIDPDGFASEGDSIIYRLTLSNIGTSAASNISVTDTLPDGVTYSRFEADQGSYFPDTFLWKNITKLEMEASIDLNIICFVDAGTQGQAILNTAAVIALQPEDLNIEDNLDTADFTVYQNPPVAGDDVYALDEGAELTVVAENGILINDSDPEGDDITLDTTLVALPAHGQVTVTADGGFVYTHDGSEFPSDSFQYRITDAPSLADTATVALVINPIDDTPVAVDDSYSVGEGQTISRDVKVNDSDVDTDMAIVNAILDQAPSHHVGTFTLNPDGTFDFIHDGIGIEPVSFVYTLNDGTSSSEPATVNITIDASCDGPVIAAGIPNQTISEGGTFVSFNLDDFVVDEDTADENIIWVLDGVANDLIVTISVDRVLTVVAPHVDWYGAETFTFVASDDCSPALEAEFFTTFTIESVNDAPVQTEIADQSTPEDTLFGDITLDDFVSDIDHMDSEIAWTYESSAGPTSNLIVVITNDRILKVSSTDNWFGDETLTLTSTDVEGGFDTQEVLFTVISVNDNPLVTDIPGETILEGELFASFDLDDFVSDVEDLDSALTWVATGQTNLTVTIDADHVVVITKDPQYFGNETITFTATDTGSGSGADSAIFIVIPEGDAPVLDFIGNKTVVEETEITFTASATDNDLDVLTFSLDPASLTNGMTIDPSTGVFSWTPTEAQGPFEFDVVVTVSDGALSDFEEIKINVSEANVAPELDPIGDQSLNELETLTFTASASDVDIPAQSLVFTLDQASINLGMTINPSTGEFSWVTDENDGDTSPSVTVTVSDGGGGADSETFTITVSGVNAAPVVDSIANQSVDEFALFTYDADGQDSDIPAQGLTFSLDAGSLALGLIINSDTGVISWTPGEQYGGQAAFTITVILTDDGPGTLSDSESFELLVNELNQSPVLDLIGNQTGNEETLITFDADANDGDIPVQTLSYALDLTSQGLGMTIDSAGVFVWNTSELTGGTSPDVTVTVSDGDGGSDSETFRITVSETNADPVLDPIGDKSTVEFNTVAFTALATDNDHPSQTLTYTLDQPSIDLGMAIHPSSGVFSWTTDELDGGTTPDIIVTVSDGNGGSDSETITITVGEVNANPFLDAIGNQSGDEETTITFDANATDSDLPGQTLVYTLDGASIALGMTINSSTGAFSWVTDDTHGDTTPDATVTVSDGSGGSDSETFTITVNEVNVAPVLVPIGNQSGDEETTITFDVDANDSDLPGETLVYSLDGPSIALGMTINSGTGAFSWVTDESDGGTTPDVTITVSDENGGSDSETFTITVNEVNVAPVLVPVGPQSGDEETNIIFDVDANDHDSPGQTLVYSLDGPSIGLGMTINSSTGAFSWVTDDTHGGTTPSITVTVDDQNGGTDSETFILTVNDVP